MNQLNEYSSSLWRILNSPLISLGGGSITPWAILLNVGLVISLLVISAKIKDWMIGALSKKKGLDHSNWRAVITLGYYAMLAIGLMAILQSTGLDLSLFTVLTGAIGIGVGFGMQNIFSNFISGIIILLEKPLKLGDRIEVENVSGSVQSISVRATTILTNDNISIIIPNSDFISKQLINWSYSGTTVRTQITVGVSYDSDAEQVTKLLYEVAAQEPGVVKTPAPEVRLVEFGESSLNFSLLVWTTEYHGRIGALKSCLNLRVLETFNRNGVRIPYPQREILVRTENAPHAPDPLKAPAPPQAPAP